MGNRYRVAVRLCWKQRTWLLCLSVQQQVSALVTTCPCRTLGFSYFLQLSASPVSLPTITNRNSFLVAGGHTFSMELSRSRTERLLVLRSGMMHSLLCLCLEHYTSTQRRSDIGRCGRVEVLSLWFQMSFLLLLYDCLQHNTFVETN